MEVMTISEVRRTFADVIAKVSLAGKRVVVERHGKPAAALISYADLLRLQELEQREAEKDSWRLALEKAEAVTTRMLAERRGEYLPDAAEIIREIREERTNEL